MPKPVLPPIGTVPCPMCGADAQVKKNKRRKLFGYCAEKCGKFGEQDNSYVIEHMQLFPEYSDEAPAAAAPAPAPEPEKTLENSTSNAPASAAPGHDQDNAGGAIPWL